MQQISVIMATYNHAHFIRAALMSILRQAYTPLEIIVVDDGSTDDTFAVIGALITETAAPIRYVQQANCGQAAALNCGLALARGEVIAFLDSDDLWPGDRLPAQLSFFAQRTAPEAQPVGIVLGRKERFADGVVVDATQLAAANQRPVHYSLGSSLFARWVFDVVGPFDEKMGHSADWDWFARARESGISMVADPRVTVLGRTHGGNFTQNRAMVAQQTTNMVKKHLDRLRAHAAIIPASDHEA